MSPTQPCNHGSAPKLLKRPYLCSRSYI
uniref:Uncharacterized protein n=1 Tax=Anguilla anguilla TaxID=7936 RepID=A0A0E9V1S0_ANGAN